MALTDKFTAIANAIRSKTGKTELMTLDEMPTEIASIETDTLEEARLIRKSELYFDGSNRGALTVDVGTVLDEEEKYYVSSSKTYRISLISPNDLGDASAKDVAQGKTFTSSSGLKIVGTGTSAGGSSRNVQVNSAYYTINQTSYRATGVSITVGKTATYNVSWMAYRNRDSGTFGTQLYIGGSPYGSAITTWSNTYGQHNTIGGISLTEGQTIELYARSGNTSYVIAVGNLIIEEV